MSGLKVRRLAAGDDISAAAVLLQRFFTEEGFATPPERIAAHVREMAGLDSCALFLAVSGLEAVGVATLSFDFGVEFGWSGEMGDLYVMPDWRGRGVARRLVAAVEEALRQRGARSYQVTVTPDGEAHHALGGFYRALGFADEGRLILTRTLAP